MFDGIDIGKGEQSLCSIGIDISETIIGIMKVLREHDYSKVNNVRRYK